MVEKFFGYYGSRNFSKSIMCRNLEKVKEPDPEKITNPREAFKMDFIPNKLERIMVEWSGKYKNKESIPLRMSYQELENAKSRFRIRTANCMMVGALLLCGCFIWEGKRRLKKGNTIHKRYLEKERKVLEELKK